MPSLPASESPERFAAASRPAPLVRTLSEAGGVSARALIGSNLIGDAMSLRAMAPTAANALGRALMGAVLVAVGPGGTPEDADGGESVQLQFRGDGPLGSVLAISDARGRVRGTVDHPETDLVLADGSPDVARAIGLGTLNVVRHKPGWREPYTGIVPLTSGEIAHDLTLYLTESEQTPSAMGLGVAVATDETAAVAAGFLVQMLPGASEAEMSRAEANVRAMPALSDLALTGAQPGEIVDLLLAGLGSREQSQSDALFHCPCTRARALATLRMLETDELEDMVRTGQGQEVRCHFCSRAYALTAAEIGELLAAP